MRLTLSAEEARALLRAFDVLPPAIGELRLDEGSVSAPVDVRALPGLGAAVRLAAALLGAVSLRVRDAGLLDGAWTLAVGVEPEVRLPGIDGLLASALRDALEPLGDDAVVRERPADGAAAGAQLEVRIALGELIGRGMASLAGRGPDGPARVRPALRAIEIRPDRVEVAVDLGIAPASAL